MHLRYRLVLGKIIDSISNPEFFLVKAWAMVALSLIAETGGGMFRGYVELALSDCLTLLLNTQSSNVEVVQGIGKLVCVPTTIFLRKKKHLIWFS